MSSKHLLLASILLVACRAQGSFPAPVSSFAGTWQGRFLAPGTDSVLVRWTWLQSADTMGSFTFGRETTSVPTRILHALADSAVVDLTRPIRPVRPERVGAAEFAFRLFVRLRGDSLTGIWRATPPEGPARTGRLEGARVVPPT